MTTPDISNTQPVTVRLFRFQETVMTPQGRGIFIAYLVGGDKCQVSRLVKGPNGGTYPKNEIWPVDQVSVWKETPRAGNKSSGDYPK